MLGIVSYAYFCAGSAVGHLQSPIFFLSSGHHVGAAWPVLSSKGAVGAGLTDVTADFDVVATERLVVA